MFLGRKVFYCSKLFYFLLFFALVMQNFTITYAQPTNSNPKTYSNHDKENAQDYQTGEGNSASVTKAKLPVQFEKQATLWEDLVKTSHVIPVHLSQEYQSFFKEKLSNTISETSPTVTVGKVLELPREFECFKTTYREGGTLVSNSSYWQEFSVLDDGTAVWVGKIEAPNCGGMRLIIEDFNLPAGVRMYWLSGPGDVRCPYVASGPLNSGCFVSHTLFSNVGFILLYSDNGEDSLVQSSFTIKGIAAIHSEFTKSISEGQKGFFPSCIVDASCYTAADWDKIDLLRRAIAMLYFMVPQADNPTNLDIRIATGFLLANQDRIPYLLTAYHAFNTQQSANSLECFWDFRTDTCNEGYTPYAAYSNYESTIGADLLETNEVAGFTLVQLKGIVPVSRVFLGYNPGKEPLDQEVLYRISHPWGAQQSFSTHKNIGTPDVSGTFLLSDFIYSIPVIGDCDLGSCGSPLVNANLHVKGYLVGHTSNHNQCPPCATSCTSYRLDGRFSTTYSSIKKWLLRNDLTATNSTFNNAIEISGSSMTHYGTNIGAKKEAGEPDHPDNKGGASVWWKWTPSISGECTIDTFNSTFNTLLAVYKGDSLENLILVAHNDDADGTVFSRVSLSAQAGEILYMAVDGFNGQTGNIILNIRMNASAFVIILPGGSGQGKIRINDRLRIPPVSIGFGLGSSITLRAIPESGSRFVKWGGEMDSQDNPVTFILNKNLTVKAAFETDTTTNEFSLTLTKGGRGNGNVRINGAFYELPWTGKFTRGKKVTLQPAPDNNSMFFAWTGDLFEEDKTLNLEMKRNYTLRAIYETGLPVIQHNLSVTGAGDGEGKILVNTVVQSLPWSNTYNRWEAITLQALPETNFVFSRWEGGIKETNNPITVILDKDIVVAAIFTREQGCCRQNKAFSIRNIIKDYFILVVSFCAVIGGTTLGERKQS